MTLSNRWNRIIYGTYAPIYDWVARPLDRGREQAIERLDLQPGERILILGCGTGADLEYLSAEVSVTAIDLTPKMVQRTLIRGDALNLEVDAQIGDAGTLPFKDDTFDVVFLHLILSVVPDPDAVVSETARVLASDGRVSIFDKFVSEGTAPSLPRRAINPMARVLFSDLTRRLEPMLFNTDLSIITRESILGGLYTVAIARPTIDK